MIFNTPTNLSIFLSVEPTLRESHNHHHSSPYLSAKSTNHSYTASDHQLSLALAAQSSHRYSSSHQMSSSSLADQKHSGSTAYSQTRVSGAISHHQHHQHHLLQTSSSSTTLINSSTSTLKSNHNSPNYSPAASAAPLPPQPPQQTPSQPPHLPKHWLWNSSFFYPPTTNRNGSSGEGFVPYSSANFSGILAPKGSINPSHHHHTHQQQYSLEKSIDLTMHQLQHQQHHNESATIISSFIRRPHHHGSDAASEDSMDDDEHLRSKERGQIASLPLTPSPSPAALSPSSTPPKQLSSLHKKKNPYSIEELLKKPEKRSRPSAPPVLQMATAFRPAILIQEDYKTISSSAATIIVSSSDCDDDKSMDSSANIVRLKSMSADAKDEEDDDDLNNNPIEICD